MTMSNEQTPAESASELPDFVLNVYTGCVLPEDYKPARTTSWFRWREENPDDYSAEQLAQIAARLRAGRSWVAFVARLETICAAEYYKPVEQRK